MSTPVRWVESDVRARGGPLRPPVHEATTGTAGSPAGPGPTPTTRASAPDGSCRHVASRAAASEPVASTMSSPGGVPNRARSSSRGVVRRYEPRTAVGRQSRMHGTQQRGQDQPWTRTTVASASVAADALAADVASTAPSERAAAEASRNLTEVRGARARAGPRRRAPRASPRSPRSRGPRGTCRRSRCTPSAASAAITMAAPARMSSARTGAAESRSTPRITAWCPSVRMSAPMRRSSPT